MTKTYTAMIDYKAGKKNGFDFITLIATNLLDAMNEAEQYMTEDTYLVHLMESKKFVTNRKTYKERLHSTSLTNRGNGWHTTDEAHSERPTTWMETTFANGSKCWKIYIA